MRLLLAAVLWNTRLSRKSHTDIISHPETWHSLRKILCSMPEVNISTLSLFVLIWSVTKIKPQEVNYFTFKHQNIFPLIFLCKNKTMITQDKKEHKEDSDEWWRAQNPFILCKLIYYCIFCNTFFNIILKSIFHFFVTKVCFIGIEIRTEFWFFIISSYSTHKLLSGTCKN